MLLLLEQRLWWIENTPRNAVIQPIYTTVSNQCWLKHLNGFCRPGHLPPQSSSASSLMVVLWLAILTILTTWHSNYILTTPTKRRQNDLIAVDLPPFRLCCHQRNSAKPTNEFRSLVKHWLRRELCLMSGSFRYALHVYIYRKHGSLLSFRLCGCCHEMLLPSQLEFDWGKCLAISQLS